MQNTFFKDALNGNKPLWFMFWVMNIGIYAACSLVFAFLAIYTANGFLISLCSLLLVSYFAFAVLGTWRSAGKYSGKRIFAVLAKVFIILQCLGMVKALL